MIAVSNKSNTFVINRMGDVLFEGQKCNLGMIQDGKLILSINNKISILGEDGSIVTTEHYEKEGDSFKVSMFREGVAPCYNRQGMYGYIRADGAWWIKPKYLKVTQFCSGIALAERETQDWVALNMGGDEICVLNNIWLLDEHDEFQLIDCSCFIAHTIVDGQWHFALVTNLTDRRILHARRRIVDIRGIADGAYAAELKDFHWKLFSYTSKPLFKSTYCYLGRISEGVLAAKQRGSEMWGVLDRFENIVVPFEYSSIGSSRFGYFVGNKNGMDCLLSRSGKLMATVQSSNSACNIKVFESGIAFMGPEGIIVTNHKLQVIWSNPGDITVQQLGVKIF